jgi:hypothetical protein
MLLIEFPHGVNETHGSFAAIHDGNSPEIMLHNPS